MASHALGFCVVRALSTSCRRAAKPGYFLHKMLSREKALEQRIQRIQEDKLTVSKRLPSEATRRQRVLNTLYMETISDILASEFSATLEPFQLCLTGVRISIDLSEIKVFWTSVTGVDTRKVAEVLEEIAPQVRQELSAVRHMGAIPKVRFAQYVGALREIEALERLDNLRKAGELDGAEPAAPVPTDVASVFGLDRDKMLRELNKNMAPADVNLAADRVEAGDHFQTLVLKRLRMKAAKTKTLENSAKERRKLEMQIYNQVFRAQDI